MTEYLNVALTLAGIAAGWYCYRWGHVDGRAEGFDEGRTKGLLEGAGIVIPSLAGYEN